MSEAELLKVLFRSAFSGPLKRETRGRVRMSEALRGVHNIMTIKIVSDKRIKGVSHRRKEIAMLFLQLKPGEYLTIGDNIAVQVFESSRSQVRLAVQAPREVPVLRGEVRERAGENRPDGLIDTSA